MPVASICYHSFTGMMYDVCDVQVLHTCVCMYVYTHIHTCIRYGNNNTCTHLHTRVYLIK